MKIELNLISFLRVKVRLSAMMLFTCMFVYMYVCLPVCLFTCTFVYLYVCLHICCFSVCLFTCMFVYMYVCLHVCLYTYMFVYIYAVSLYVCLPVCLFLCMFVSLYAYYTTIGLLHIYTNTNNHNYIRKTRQMDGMGIVLIRGD